MDIFRIRRDCRGLAQTRYCHETVDGRIIISDEMLDYEIRPCQIANAALFAELWLHLTEKEWFTRDVALDLINVVAARWLADANLWV